MRQGLTRRTILGGGGGVLAAGLAGCTGGGEPAMVVADITAYDDGESFPLFEDEEATIEDGDFFGWEFSLDWEHEIEYTVEVTDGPDVGVYITEGTEFARIQDEGEFEAVEDAMWPDVNFVSDSVVLNEGDYWLIVLNPNIDPLNA